MSNDDARRLLATEPASVVRCVLHGAVLAETLLLAPIPEPIRERYESYPGLKSDVRFLRRSVAEPYFTQVKGQVAARFRQLLFKIALYRDPRALSALLARYLVPSRHCASLALPDRLFVLHYALWPLAYLNDLWRKIRGQ